MTLLVQITDTHITRKGDRLYGLVDSADNLRRTVRELNRLRPAPDLVVITGDLVEVPDRESYDHFSELIEPIHAPVIIIPGNHDDPDFMASYFADTPYFPVQDPTCQYAIEHHDFRILALNSHAGDSELPMLFVSHRMEEVASVADRLLLLRDGHVDAEGPLPELLARLDNSLAEDENAASILHAQVTASHSDFGLTELRADGHPLFVASGAEPGATRRVRIPARDVSVCRQMPQETSILNIIPVTVDSLRAVSKTHCILRLRLEEQFLLARITERSRSELSLQRGDQLYAQIKSSALLDDRSPP